jgi:hypothetical protein
MFEIDWASKYTVVSKAWFSAIAVLVRCCWVSILVSDILGWARIDNVDGVSMCMMEEGTAKSGSIQENGFVLFIYHSSLVVLGRLLQVYSEVIACCGEFC